MSVIKVKVIVPYERFEEIFSALKRDAKCREKWCRYSRTTCHVRQARDGILVWWKEVNGNIAGFSHYEVVFQNCIRRENKLYWAFWTNDMRPCRQCYDELIAQVRLAFEGKPIDDRGFSGHRSAWKDVGGSS